MDEGGRAGGGRPDGSGRRRRGPIGRLLELLSGMLSSTDSCDCVQRCRSRMCPRRTRKKPPERRGG